MKPFAYTRPNTLDEVVTLLAEPNGHGTVRPLAGGTDLLTLMKMEIVTPDRLIDIKRLPDLTREIELTGDGLTIGALTTLAQIEADESIRAHFSALSDAAALAATPQLRHAATIGGNLLQRPRCWYFRHPQIDCWLKGGAECPARAGENQLHALFGDSTCVAVHPSDLATALVTLDAELRLRGKTGERLLPLAEFFALPVDERRTENILNPDEIIISIHLPLPAEVVRSIYLKAMDRKIWAFALVGVAAMARVTDGRIEAARLTLGGVAPIPWRLTAAERELTGAVPDADLFTRVADLALADAAPLAHNAYKVTLAKTLIRRALKSVTGA